MLVETNATLFSSVDCEHAPFIKDISRNAFIYFLLCFQLEKYQDVIKATEEFETKLMSLGMCFGISNCEFTFTEKNLKFMIGQDC